MSGKCVDAAICRRTCLAILFVVFIKIFDLPTSAAWPSYMCPNGGRDVHPIRGATPYGNASAGRYVSKGNRSLGDCVRLCCAEDNPISACHTVFHYDGRCLLVHCTSQRMCDPLVRTGDKFKDYYVVNVRTAAADEDADDIDGSFPGRSNSYLTPLDELANEPLGDDLFGQFMDFPPGRQGPQERSSSSAISPSKLCDLSGLPGQCPPREQCMPKNNRARQGVCLCESGDHVRDPSSGLCVEATLEGGSPIADDQSPPPLPKNEPSSNLSLTAIASPTAADSSTTTSTASTGGGGGALHHLVVSAGDSKVIRLPENFGTLSAYAVTSGGGVPYKYEWSLVAHPPGDDVGILRDKNTATVKFSGLKEGLYRFKVAVSNEVSFGEAYVNVTVLAPERVNKAPVAVINPLNQTVKLPNTDVVLDGSASTDDDGITSYVWEVVTAPIDYSMGSSLSNAAILQLKSLVPGSYTFMLTVTDTDGVKNSTNANILVNKETDYPPTANAGPDVIVYLPKNEVTLNGSLSYDDKGIKSYEWTKGITKGTGTSADAESTEKAVDMQDTRTPLLHLSNLDIGIYTFVLRVTDTADQSSTAEVHVFVKPGKEGPFANAGSDQAIALPVNSVKLDGSKSHDDIGISRWEWKQVSGPTKSVLTDADKSEAVASMLTKGVYVFQLAVYDSNGASGTNTTAVTVLQSKNEPPKANAGGDLTMELPRSLIVLNGSSSRDDGGLLTYSWIRDPTSLAVGEIVEGSDKQQFLMLTGLLPGRYLFKLTVTDAEGVSDSDTASLIVKPSSGEKDDVEIKLASDVLSFSEEQKITLSKKLALLLQDDSEANVVVTRVSMERNTRRVFLVFHVERDLGPNRRAVVQRGPDVVQALRSRLRMDAGLLGVPVLSIETVVCQNNCSGHGSCDPYTKRCVCEAFWMEDLFRAQLLGGDGDGDSNCDWSILYVVIAFTVGLIFMVLFSWSLFCICNRKQKNSSRSRSASKSRRLRRRHRYTLLDERNSSDAGNIGVVVPLAGKMRNGGDSVMLSDSDLSESETVFDKSKPAAELAKHPQRLDADDQQPSDETTVVRGFAGRSSPPSSHKLRTEKPNIGNQSASEFFVSASE